MAIVCGVPNFRIFTVNSGTMSIIGARFTKNLKPKVLVSSIQTVWNLQKS